MLIFYSIIIRWFCFPTIPNIIVNTHKKYIKTIEFRKMYRTQYSDSNTSSISMLNKYKKLVKDASTGCIMR